MPRSLQEVKTEQREKKGIKTERKTLWVAGQRGNALVSDGKVTLVERQAHMGREVVDPRSMFWELSPSLLVHYYDPLSLEFPLRHPH